MEVAAPRERPDTPSARRSDSAPPPSSAATVRREDIDDVPVRGPDGQLMPSVGDDFEGFVLVAELGRGSFGRVYLARQTAMANRAVALKVTLEFFDETQTLSQLQHTNIVPIYSAHGDGRLRALCMPYFGAITLADVCKELKLAASMPTSGKHLVSTLELRRASTQAGEAPASDSEASLRVAQSVLEDSNRMALGARPTFELLSRFTFVEAVLWLGARLADGLAHAHERGIIHRDIKPANVLLADDGRPMLLDFNLSASRQWACPSRGGTLPYMAPEQLRAQLETEPEAIDGRADIYALGLVLYELLAGDPAYPRHKGNRPEIVRLMLKDRHSPPPRLAGINAAVSPAVEAIISKCLAFDPDRRYDSARALQEDLERQLAHRSLRHVPEPSFKERVSKWRRRHPVAASVGSMILLAGSLVLLLAYGMVEYRQRLGRQEVQLATQAAEAKLAAWLPKTEHLRHELIRAPEGESRRQALANGRTALAEYGLPANPDWQSAATVTRLNATDGDRLRGRIGELLALVTQAELDRAEAAPSKDQLQLNDAAASLYPGNQRPHYWWTQREQILRQAGDEAGAAAAATAAQAIQPTLAMDRYLSAVERYRAGRYRDAVTQLSVLAKEDPQHFGAWFVLGACQYKLGQDADAIASFSKCIVLNPKSYPAYVNRGYANYRVQKESALDDFQTAQDLGANDPEIGLQMAKCHQALKQFAQAEAICTELLVDDSVKLRALMSRANTRRLRGNAAGAADDRAAVAKLTPATAADFIARGSAQLQNGNAAAALADFQRAEELNPRLDAALMNQAHILAEKTKPAKTAEAIAILDRLIQRSPDSPDGLAARAVLLARAGRGDDALRDAKRSLSLSRRPIIRFQAADVYALTADRPGHVQEALKLLAAAIHDQELLAAELESDPDLHALRSLPEFRRLAEAAKIIKPMD